MDIKLIDTKNDQLIMPTNTGIITSTNLSRRDFLAYSLLAPSLALIPYREAQAFWAVLLGIVARSVIQGVARFVGRSVARRLVGRTGAGAFVSFSSRSTRIQAAIVEEVVTDLTKVGITTASAYAIHQLALKKPQALWAKDNKANLLSLGIENKTNKPIETSFSLVLEDMRSKKIEVRNNKLVTIAQPFKKAAFDIKSFSNLPTTGMKRVIGIVPSSEKGLSITPTGKIMVMKTTDIYQ